MREYAIQFYSPHADPVDRWAYGETLPAKRRRDRGDIISRAREFVGTIARVRVILIDYSTETGLPESRVVWDSSGEPKREETCEGA